MNKFVLLFFILFLSACTSSVPTIETKIADKDRQILYRNFLQAKKNTPSDNTAIKYQQPINKKEKCLLPESGGYRPDNIKIYWDGGCQKGFAFGLGREIVIGDYIHIEEITEHSANNYSNSLPYDGIIWWRDYINNVTICVRHTKSTSEEYYSGIWSQIFDTVNFNVNESLGRRTKDEIWQVVNDLNMPTFQRYIYSNLFYRYETGFNNDPEISIKQFARTVNNRTNKDIGVISLLFTDNTIRQIFNDNEVLTNQDYWNDYNLNYNKVEQYASEALNDASQANALYNKYLHKACNLNVKTEGIPTDLFKKICSYDANYVDKIRKVQVQNQQLMERKQNEANVQRIIRAREAEAQAAIEQANSIRQNMILNRLPKYIQCNTLFNSTNCTTY